MENAARNIVSHINVSLASLWKQRSFPDLFCVAAGPAQEELIGLIVAILTGDL